MKIGLLIIATNKYTDFINNLIESTDKYFCNNVENKFRFFRQNKRNLVVRFNA